MPKKSFEKWLLEQIEFYKPYLELNLQEIDVEKSEDDYLALSMRYPYQEPRLFYSSKAETDWKKGDFEKKCVLHELLHHITDPLYCKATNRYVGKTEIEDERERLTDTLTIILNNLIK